MIFFVICVIIILKFGQLVFVLPLFSHGGGYMLVNDPVFNKIANSLLADYTSVYYVNAVTNQYQWYSANSEFHSLQIEPVGEDFFKNLIRDADKVVYEEDKHLFMKDMKKEKLLAQMKKGAKQNIVYRLVIDGKPVYHSLRLIRGLSDEDDYFILGVLNIDAEYRTKLENEKLEKEREIFNQIAGSLADHYDTLYYIDANTGKYFEYSSNELYKKLEIPDAGEDFFTESRKNIQRLVHPDDLDDILTLYYKENMLKSLENKKVVYSTYRLIIDGRPSYYRSSIIWASDREHIIVCIENIDAEISVEEALKETRRKSITYGQIAESLASHYDVIYYVDLSSNNYSEFTAKSIYGDIDILEEGKDFFEDAKRNGKQLVHENDLERVLGVLDRDYLISALESRKQYSIDYRLMVDGKVQHTRLTVMWSSDKVHFIIGVENINEQVKKEKEQLKALNVANELARRDELTGVKNKKAYNELENSVNSNLESGMDFIPFAVVVCDINNLKLVNDTQGHKAGDDYIRLSCRLICNIFTHSQVFRIGGDEFVAFLGSGDYQNRHELMQKLSDTVRGNIKSGEGPVVAAGIADFDPNIDRFVESVFERADSQMYKNKNDLKDFAMGLGGTPEHRSIDITIPDDRRKYLQGLFDALSIVADGSYVYLCDMKYDFSIWSRNAVDIFGLPSEYMYRAGDIWEERIHPEDRETYHRGIDDIFTGNLQGHDMQYRARRINGDYDVCTCRGLVLKDSDGEPDYFCGTIRNHGIHGQMDTLTGLRNMYGFFEDLQSLMVRNTKFMVGIVGMSKFSEINEIYGYHFGNRVLQRFGRYLFEHTGNMGNAYRLDGTKFAIVSSTQTSDEFREKYEDLRDYFRENFTVDDRSIILELNSGMLSVENFDIDYQTVYACLNYAYSESKLRRHGDIVEFDNTINDENRHSIEMLHVIRASIMHDYNGFYLLYQPVVDAQTEKLVAAEALLRWRNDEYGIVPPDHFIPVLERDPLFPDLGEWILRTSIVAAKKIRELYPDFIINVNLSYSQIEKPEFVEMVMHILRNENYPPENLCLEITERCRLLDMDLLKNVVVNLRGSGVKIALDDFGTGFSSVGLVKNLAFDVIKIDRSFVLKIEQDEKERKLIEHFVKLGSIFGANICVEGIETAQMRDILKQYGVSGFQGYYYSKPILLDDIMKWKDPQ